MCRTFCFPLSWVVVCCMERYEEIEMLTPIICLRLLTSLTAMEGRLPHEEIRGALYVTSSSCVYILRADIAVVFTDFFNFFDSLIPVDLYL